MKSLKQLLEDTSNPRISINENIEQDFIKDFNRALISKESVQTHPKGLYRPSSIHGCARMLYFQQTDAPQDSPKDEDEWTYKLISICECGTDRHTRIQNVIQTMHDMDMLRMIDIEEHIKTIKNPTLDTEFVKWNEDKTEARCKSEKYHMYFQPDGLIEYKGITCILEIKTANGFKFNKIQKENRPRPEHVEQATCYANLLDVDYILFVYEDNNFKTKHVMLHKVDNFDKRKMERKITLMDKYLANNEVPPAEKDKCMYCKYKTYCKELGE